MHFHVASRGLAINFGFPAGGGGVCFNCPNKIIKNFPRSLSSLGFYKFNSYQATLISQFPKFIWFWWFYCYNFDHADFDRKLINQAFRYALLFLVFLHFPTIS